MKTNFTMERSSISSHGPSRAGGTGRLGKLRAAIARGVSGLFRGGLGGFASAAVALAALAQPVSAVEITLPAETSRLIESPLPGYALAQAMCLTCHSPDYLRMQPPSSRAYWQAAVTKMQKTFGAPIPDSALPPIVDYLAKTYGTERIAAESPIPGSAKSGSTAAQGRGR